MASLPEDDLTTRTLLKRVLATEPTHTPLPVPGRDQKPKLETRRRSLRLSGPPLPPPETPASLSPSTTLRNRMKERVRRSMRITRASFSRPQESQASSRPAPPRREKLDEDTPRTILKNIMQTAPEASMLVPSTPAPVVEEVQPLLESRQSSLDLQLQLPELEPLVPMAQAQLGSGWKRRKLRLSEFERGVDQGLAASVGAPSLTTPAEEPLASADTSSLTKSFNLSLVTPVLPESVKRPGLARRPKTRKAINMEAFEQGLEKTPLPMREAVQAASADSWVVADTLLGDTQLFLQASPRDQSRPHHSQLQPAGEGNQDLVKADVRRTRNPSSASSQLSPARPLDGASRSLDRAQMSRQSLGIRHSARFTPSRNKDIREAGAEPGHRSRMELEGQVLAAMGEQEAQSVEEEGQVAPLAGEDEAKTLMGEGEGTPLAGEDGPTMVTEEGKVASSAEEEEANVAEAEEEAEVAESVEEEKEGEVVSEEEGAMVEDEEAEVAESIEGDRGVPSLERDRVATMEEEEDEVTPLVEKDEVVTVREENEVATAEEEAEAAESVEEDEEMEEDDPEPLVEEDGLATVEEEEVETEAEGSEEHTGAVREAEISLKTPAFIQAKRKQVFGPSASPSPAKLPPKSFPTKQARARGPARAPRPPRTPGSALLSHYAKIFGFYAKMPVEKAAYKVVEKSLDRYFRQLGDDLEVFTSHAGRKTVEVEDLELLMRRQGLVTDDVSLHVLVERHLPMEYRRLLIPCATSGNRVSPALGPRKL
ncbi:centromere protein T [Tachyglossus aculeatus]|uniref:centromere protein T n=1 Tax=Tachyglossus aculeatus TaxID=9261 RepID=UPI0018F5F199|nr:centromere protein T [Tachyglossus aculeatus]